MIKKAFLIASLFVSSLAFAVGEWSYVGVRRELNDNPGKYDYIVADSTDTINYKTHATGIGGEPGCYNEAGMFKGNIDKKLNKELFNTINSLFGDNKKRVGYNVPDDYSGFRITYVKPDNKYLSGYVLDQKGIDSIEELFFKVKSIAKPINAISMKSKLVGNNLYVDFYYIGKDDELILPLSLNSFRLDNGKITTKNDLVQYLRFSDKKKFYNFHLKVEGVKKKYKLLFNNYSIVHDDNDSIMGEIIQIKADICSAGKVLR